MEKNDVVEQEATETPEVDEQETDHDESAEELQARLEKAEKEKEALLGRLKRAESKKKKAPKAESSEIINNTSDDDRIERLELKLDGYADGEIEEIMKFGGKAFLQTELGKKAADLIRDQRKAEEAAKIETSAKSEFESKYSDQDLKDMSAEELKKILPKAN